MENKQKVGGYSITTTKSWLETPVKNVIVKKKKTKAALEIIYPRFLEISKLTDDFFWINVFSQMSIGKFPQKYIYKDGIISFKKGRKINSLEIPSDNLEAFFKCKEFYYQTSTLESEIDKEKTKLEESIREEEKEEWTSWSSISKKLKNILIDNYVVFLENLFLLNKKEKASLRNTINLGIILSYFNKENIIMENRKIKEILGLLFNDSNREFFIDPDIQQKSSKNSIKGKELITSFIPYDHFGFVKNNKNELFSKYKEWNDFLKNVEKNHDKAIGLSLKMAPKPLKLKILPSNKNMNENSYISTTPLNILISPKKTAPKLNIRSKKTETDKEKEYRDSKYPIIA